MKKIIFSLLSVVMLVSMALPAGSPSLMACGGAGSEVVAACVATAPDFSICQGMTVNDQLFLDNGASCSGGCAVSLSYSFDGSTPGDYPYTVTCEGECGGDTDDGTVTVTVIETAGIHTEKSASPTTIHSGDLVTYTIVVTNTGGCDLTVDVVDDVLGDIALEVSLASGASVTYNPTANPTTTKPTTTVTNTVTATGTDAAGETVSDSDTATVTVCCWWY